MTTEGGPAGPPCHVRTPTVLWWKWVDRLGTPLRGRGNADQSALVQDLGDLDRVGRGALEQVVADDPHLQAARVARVAAQAADLGLPTVPVLFRGIVGSEAELEALTVELTGEPSAFGGAREGVVVRRAGEFPDAEFSRSLGKWVRKDHVQTDEHWMHQAIRAQRLLPR